jgi:hypothetical protein
MALSELYAELLLSSRRVGAGGLSPRTVQYVHRILTHAFGDAVRWGFLARNPATPVDPPRVRTRDNSRSSRTTDRKRRSCFADHTDI